MTRELLGAEDARILALESGTVRGHTCKVLVIAGERSAEQVRARLEERPPPFRSSRGGSIRRAARLPATRRVVTGLR
jgi:hypothetical protein